MKILMIGPDRDVQGGVSTVINNYYLAGLDKIVDLKFIATMKDGSKIIKLKAAIDGYLEFKKNIEYYEIIHIHMASRASFYRKSFFVNMAKKKGKKIIIHMHGAEFRQFYMDESNEKQREYITNILNKADKIIALSEKWKEFIESITKTSVEVVYNSIFIPDVNEKKYDSNQILFLGRLGKRKGVYDLLEVMPALIKNNKNIKLKICGDGEVEEVKKYCNNMNLNSNVEINEWIKGEEKERILYESNIFVLPSYNEGMPMSILEAMSYKNAVLSTEVGGIPEVIINENIGVLIKPGDKEQLYFKLSKLLEDKKLLRSMGENSYKRVSKDFNIKNSIEKLIEIYAEVKGVGGGYSECQRNKEIK